MLGDEAGPSHGAGGRKRKRGVSPASPSLTPAPHSPTHHSDSADSLPSPGYVRIGGRRDRQSGSNSDGEGGEKSKGGVRARGAGRGRGGIRRGGGNTIGGNDRPLESESDSDREEVNDRERENVRKRGGVSAMGGRSRGQFRYIVRYDLVLDWYFTQLYSTRDGADHAATSVRMRGSPTQGSHR